MRGLLLGAAVALAVPSATPAQPPAAQDSGERDLQDLREIYAALAGKDCKGALRLARPKLAPKTVATMRPDVAATLYHMVAYCLAQTGDGDAARRVAVEGTALDAASDDLWQLRLGLELESSDARAAVATVVAMTQGRGRALNAVPIRWLYQLNRKLKTAGDDELRLALLRIVTDDAYDPAGAWVSKDGFRKSLAELLHARGDVAGAAALVREIEDADTLFDLSLDLRFRAMLPPDFDVRAATEAELALAREEMRIRPDALAPIAGAARSLRVLGRPKEAIELLETARADGKRLEQYSDAVDQANWWWDEMARAHEMLGDADATFAAFREGAAAGEHGGVNVSQQINLAHAYNRFGKWRDALAALSALGGAKSTSPYGAMELNLARGCANAALGDAGALAKNRAFAEAHEKDHPEALGDLLLCAGDLDAAAAAFIRALADPDRRVRTLKLFSDYDAPLPGRPLYVFEARIGELGERPDVKEAIERAGGKRRVRIQNAQL